MWLETETFQFWEEWKSLKTFDQSQIEKANPRYTWYKQPISSSPQRTVIVVTFHTFTLYYPYNLGITDNIKLLAKKSVPAGTVQNNKKIDMEFSRVGGSPT